MSSRNRSSVSVPTKHFDVSLMTTRQIYTQLYEIGCLLTLFESAKARTIVEFGVNEGQTALVAMRTLPTIERYVGVEVQSGYVPPLAAQCDEVPAMPGALAHHMAAFELIVRPNGTRDLTASELPTCDAVFIDADHSRAGVVRDYALAEAIVRPGGFIVFHDDNELPEVEVTETLNDWCAEGMAIKHVTGTWLAYCQR